MPEVRQNFHFTDRKIRAKENQDDPQATLSVGGEGGPNGPNILPLGRKQISLISTITTHTHTHNYFMSVITRKATLVYFYLFFLI